MENEKTYEVDRLSDVDKGNFAENKRVLLELHPNALNATDECAELLARIGELFGGACDYDRYNTELNDWLKRQPGNAQEQVKFLEQAMLIGQTAGSDPVADAKAALNKGCSVVARVYLVLRLGRDFLFGLTDLLRSRVTSALGYLRVQTESLAILTLLREDAAMAVDWLDADNGKAFFDNNNRRIVGKIREFDLYRYYENGSNMSQHSRVLGVASGIVIGKKTAPAGNIKLSYPEIDDASVLFLWFCVYLRAHLEMIEKLPQALPEVDFKQIDVKRYNEMVKSLWAKLQSMNRQQQRSRTWPIWIPRG